MDYSIIWLVKPWGHWLHGFLFLLFTFKQPYMEKITQSGMNCYFHKPIGKGKSELYTTSDNMVFDDKEEATRYASKLDDTEVITWLNKSNGVNQQKIDDDNLRRQANERDSRRRREEQACEEARNAPKIRHGGLTEGIDICRSNYFD